jgi:glycosyltransferase involved in cell wall biosynthesis
MAASSANELSVIICTHNPRSDYLRRVLDALKAQTLPREQFELLVIDNASKEPLHGKWDLAWHTRGRIIREDEVGLTAARLRGLRESKGGLCVFVDDDNVLDSSYLEKALAIHARFPQLGVYGAGQIKGDFETQPTPELTSLLVMLALRDEKKPVWSNLPNWNSSIPFGAGLCVLKEVGLAYADAVASDRLRRSLGRSGQALLSGEDVDLALFACKLGYGMGVFPELSLIHLIPASRLNREYLIALAEGHATSHALLAHLWGYGATWKENVLLERLRYLRKLFALKGIHRAICRAEWRGRKKIGKLIRGWQHA